MNARAILATLTFVTLGACASTAPPVERLVSTDASIRAAHAAGAEADPFAEAHLRLAREQFGRAKTLMERGKNERAAWMLARSEADAKLAVGLEREAVKRREAERAAELERVSRDLPSRAQKSTAPSGDEAPRPPLQRTP